MIESKIGQRIGGLCIVAIAGGFTAWMWYLTVNEGYRFRKAAALSSALAVIGLGLLLFPIDVERVQAEHGVRYPQKLSHYPLIWRVWTFVAVITALGNFLALTQWQ